MFLHRYAGVTTVNLANNHFLDYGPELSRHTVEKLKKNNISTFGVTYGKAPQKRQVSKELLN